MIDTKSFEKIDLESLSKVELMNRSDKKFFFSGEMLNEILQKVKEDYYMLEINGTTLLPYSTTYFDTWNKEMYLAHHNGKLNRFKIRKRRYGISGLGFLEVKFKNNKGRTLKTRVKSEYNNCLNSYEKRFLKERIPYNVDQLAPELSNSFYRITLVDKRFTSRCTIDTGLSFNYKDRQKSLTNLVVLEVKYSALAEKSSLMIALRDAKINSSGFSKYAIGKSLTDDKIKINQFKQKLRTIEKRIIR